MTDLEIIRELCKTPNVPYNAVCEIYLSELSEIQEAAERMAARIEELEKHIEFQETLKKINAELTEELTRKYNERPEVVRCGECEKVNTNDCPTIKIKSENTRMYWETGMTIYDYCSRGVRKAKGKE